MCVPVSGTQPQNQWNQSIDMSGNQRTHSQYRKTIVRIDLIMVKTNKKKWIPFSGDVLISSLQKVVFSAVMNPVAIQAHARAPVLCVDAAKEQIFSSVYQVPNTHLLAESFLRQTGENFAF